MNLGQLVAHFAADCHSLCKGGAERHDIIFKRSTFICSGCPYYESVLIFGF
jgi:hypothetical protein